VVFLHSSSNHLHIPEVKRTPVGCGVALGGREERMKLMHEGNDDGRRKGSVFGLKEGDKHC
jgi:hypothetical protein